VSAASFDVAISPVRLDPLVTRTRAPMMPAFARGHDFERRFDPLTLFNDIFWEANGESIMAIGPHVPAHLDPESDIRFFDAESGEALASVYLPSRFQIHGDCYRISPGARIAGLGVQFGGQRAMVAIQPNGSHLLAGKRVLTNRCHNDPIPWLVDWAWYHASEFGFNAVVHYDNYSTAYTVEEVRLALSHVPGIDTVIVLAWPFPMEPAHAVDPITGRIVWQRQLRDRWAESCRLEHQRRRFLDRAELVLVADVDELIVQRNPQTGIGELLAEPDIAWVRVESELVVNVDDPLDRLMRHRDLHWIWDNPGFRTPKYLVKPDRCPDDARWWLHDIAGAPGREVSTGDFTVAHFYALSTGWGGKNDRARKHVPAPNTHHQDLELRATLERVFDAFPSAQESGSIPDPHLLRNEAYQQARAGNPASALCMLRQAIAIDPYHPVQHTVRKQLIEELS
jgi:hypothetical protein